MYQRIANIVSQIRNKTDFVPQIGVVLGSGLGEIANSMDVVTTISYNDLDGMPVSTAPGHKGEFVFGYISSKPVILMNGRLHYYEGYETSELTIPMRVMHLLGVKELFLSNAAGGVNPDFKVGDLMVITDHISFIPNPLRGPNIDEFGPRFPAMHSVYDGGLIQCAMETAAECGLYLKQGVYVGLTGPSFETRAEYRFVRTIGGSAVGMSTTPEAVVAAHMGMKVLAISLISNIYTDDPSKGPTDEEVLIAGQAASGKMSKLFSSIIAKR